MMDALDRIEALVWVDENGRDISLEDMSTVFAVVPLLVNVARAARVVAPYRDFDPEYAPNIEAVRQHGRDYDALEAALQAVERYVQEHLQDPA